MHIYQKTLHIRWFTLLHNVKTLTVFILKHPVIESDIWGRVWKSFFCHIKKQLLCSQSKVNILFGSKKLIPKLQLTMSTNSNISWTFLSSLVPTGVLLCWVDISSIFPFLFYSRTQMCFFITVVNFCGAAPNQDSRRWKHYHLIMLCFLGHAVSHLQTICYPLSAETPIMDLLQIACSLSLRVDRSLGPWTFLSGNPAHLVCGFSCVNSLCFSMTHQPANHLSL